MHCQWKDKVLSVTAAGFDELALEIFQFQYRENEIYRQYVDAIGRAPGDVHSTAQIPFLPIRFFKTHAVKSGDYDPALVFESSGTTGSANSRHLVKDTGLYESIFTKCFESFYGATQNWCIVGLLPSYLERKNSSLVYMVNDLILKSKHPSSGFYLHDHQSLLSLLETLSASGQPVLLLGVTFGLLDFAEAFSNNFPSGLFRNVVVMETGGMKGRRKEMIREEVHAKLKQAFDLPVIHSEYGMTELMSQAYSHGHGRFHCPPWMRVMIRDEEDPLSIRQNRNGSSIPVSGAINIIDLANVYSCSFIATDDAGRLHADNSFEVMGRLDNSDLRGCSLMVTGLKFEV